MVGETEGEELGAALGMRGEYVGMKDGPREGKPEGTFKRESSRSLASEL